MQAVTEHRQPGIGRAAALRRPWVILGAAMAAYAALELWLTRGTTMFIDEVSMFVSNDGLHPNALAAPFNEHLELARRLLYAICLPLFGAGGSFLVAKLVEIAGVIVLTAVVFVFTSRRVGQLAALAGALLLLFFGSAWELNFAISGIGNVLALAAGTGALLALERDDRRGDIGACLLLVVSVVSFTTGIAFAVGAAVLVLTRRAEWRRLWIALVPLAVYGAWLVWVRLVYVPANGEVQHLSAYNVLLIPNMIAQQASSTAGALTGLNYNFEPTDAFAVFSTSSPFGGPLAALGAAALVWRMRRGAHPMLWALLAALLAYWAELAIGSGVGRTPTTIRYVYAAGTITLMLAAVAVGREVRPRTALIVLYAVVGLALLGNLARLRDGMNLYRAFGTAMRAQLAGIELARPTVAPAFSTPIGAPLFVPVIAGPYLKAVARYGSPAFSEQQLLGEPPDLRHDADAVLVAALGVHASARPASEHPPGCRVALGASLSVSAPGVELQAPAPAALWLSRYGPPPGAPVGELAAGGLVELRIAPGASTRPWRLTLSPAPPAVTLCPLPGG